MSLPPSATQTSYPHSDMIRELSDELLSSEAQLEALELAANGCPSATPVVEGLLLDISTTSDQLCHMVALSLNSTPSSVSHTNPRSRVLFLHSDPPPSAPLSYSQPRPTSITIPCHHQLDIMHQSLDDSPVYITELVEAIRSLIESQKKSMQAVQEFIRILPAHLTEVQDAHRHTVALSKVHKEHIDAVRHITDKLRQPSQPIRPILTVFVESSSDDEGGDELRWWTPPDRGKHRRQSST